MNITKDRQNIKETTPEQWTVVQIFEDISDATRSFNIPDRKRLEDNLLKTLTRYYEMKSARRAKPKEPEKKHRWWKK